MINSSDQGGVFVSKSNEELMQENTELKEENAELKRQLSVLKKMTVCLMHYITVFWITIQIIGVMP